MQNAIPSSNQVDSSPTKEFFVDMLTRDIELSDAILDLLDNCLDGVVRQLDKHSEASESRSYGGYTAKIEITPSRFRIIDNCGGIPKEIALKYAFRMGRAPDDPSDNDKTTVGVYGIGMKRAIFKMGLSATVTTRNGAETYCVEIPLDWVKSSDWVFPLADLKNTPDSIADGGTIVEITNFNSTCANQWEDLDAISQYSNHLISAIRESYSFIIEKGFEISVNNIEITANPVQIKFDANTTANSIKPYVYFDEIDGVKVSLTVGLYSSLLSLDEIEDREMNKRSSDDAGVTVICNDRVILYNDKTHLTGWGEAGVPKYHTQFISIKGLVFFESTDPEKLPTTTTKRGINLNSEIYSKVKERLREGLKAFTSYTNKWKGRIDEEKEISSTTKAINVEKFLNRNTITEEYSVRLSKVAKSEFGVRFMPELPEPKIESATVQIRYSRPKVDVDFVCRELFDSPLDAMGSARVGEACFDSVFKDLKTGL